MKHLKIIFCILFFIFSCGCVSEENNINNSTNNENVFDEYKISNLTVYEKEIDCFKNNKVGYIVVFVDENKNSYQSFELNEPMIYTKVEINETYMVKYKYQWNNFQEFEFI